MNLGITFNDREVNSPLIRFTLTVLAGLAAIMAILLVIFFIKIAIGLAFLLGLALIIGFLLRLSWGFLTLMARALRGSTANN